MFMLIGLGLLTLVIFLSCTSVGYVAPENYQGRIKRWLVELDLVLFISCLIFKAYVLRLALFVYTAQAIFAAFVLIAVLLRLLKRKFLAPSVDFDRSRRRLLKRAILYPATALATAGYGSFWEKNHTVVREYNIPVADLPDNLAGFRLAQLSDVHLGAFFSVEELDRLITQAARALPDALVLTGDVFDDVRLNDSAIGLVNRRVHDFPCGIWYCHGNHEHFRGIKHIEKMLATTDIHVLINSHEVAVSGSRPLVIAGVDYPAHRADDAFMSDKREYLTEALEGAPPAAVKILLAHHPEFIDDGAEQGVILTLTGHTHGGQICLFGYPLFPVFKYNKGMIKKGDKFGYVHSGNGSWFPCRLGCPPEIAVFTLTKA